MATPDNEQVRYDILIEAKSAIEALREIGFATQDNKKKILDFSSMVLQQSKLWGVSWQQALRTYKQLNAELSKGGKKTIFGNTGGQDLFSGTEKYLQALQDSKRMQQEVGNSAQEMGKKIESGSRQGVKGIDILRTAMGVLVSMLIFQVIQAIQMTFGKLIHNIRETELAIYNLINAERRLSEEGIDVTPKGLQETIEAVRELVPILSQIQSEELVSRIATNVAPSLKLTNEQIRQMAESVALLYVRNKALGKSFDEVESQLTNAFLTGKVSQGINNLGVKLSDQIVKDEALRMGLVKTEEEFNNLTGEMEAQIKASAMLSVVYQNATGDIQSLGNYMQTTDAQVEKVSSAWDNFLTTLGTAFGPALTQSLEMVAHALEIVVKLLERTKEPIQNLMASSAALLDTMKGKGSQPFSLQGILQLLASDEFQQNFDRIKQGMEGLAEATDTPTAAIDDLQNKVNDFDADKFQQEIDDILEDADRAREDIDSKLQDKKEDLDLEYDRKRLDAERDYFRKVEDINRDAEREIANLKEEQREEDLRAEQDYQNKLWELRMRYLLNLEDALHARDARQVIRLMKEYDIDKEALERKKNLDDQQREEDQRDALEDIEIKRQQRLEDARIEYQEKLEDLNIAKQRELDDLAVWYDRELADLQQATQRKLETLLAGWIEEQKLTEANAAQVYGILYKYFGPGGMTDALYQYMMQSMLQAQAAAISAGPGIIGTHPVSPPGGEEDPGHRRGGLQMAEGGTLLATRSTKVEFGEAGPELATFIPLNRIGRDVGKLMSSPGGMGGRGDGKLLVELLLSPDLEARVIEKSMDNVGDVIARVNRTKL